MTIAIIDYGMGNIFSLKSAIKKVAPDSRVIYTNDKVDLSKSDKLFLPGVGNFKVAANKLRELGLVNIIKELVKKEGKPIMGICLGMQLLFEHGTESGETEGLGLIRGKVSRFTRINGLKVPHMGFNTVKVDKDSRLFSGMSHFDFYFVHSYRVKDIPDHIDSYGTCQYGEEFIATVESENVFGVQFHPEKSQANGLKLIHNFLNI